MPSRRRNRWTPSIVVALLTAVLASLVISAPQTASAAEGTAVISGVLRDDHQQPIADARVSAYVFDEYYKQWVIRYAATTGADGAYTIGDLPAGTYRVGLEGGSNQAVWAPTYWQGAATVQEAKEITLAAGATIRSIDLESAPAGTISGVLTAAGDQQSPSVQYVLHRRIVVDKKVSWIEMGAVYSAPGPFTIRGLAAGTYRLQFLTYAQSHMSEFWQDAETLDAATDITLSAGQHLTGITAELRATPAMRGTITGVDSAPIAGADVEVMRLTNTPSGPYWDPFAAFTTAKDGTYSGRLRPGAYKFWVHKDGYTAAYSGNVSTVAEATVLDHVEGKTLVMDLTLVRKGSIAGTLTSSSGTPLTMIKAVLYAETADGDGEWEPVQTRTTYDNGVYSFTDVKPGSYVVGFNDPRGVFASEFWDDTPLFEQADEIVIGTGDTVSGIDAVLDGAGAISGRVSAPAGVDVDDVEVTAYTLTGTGRRAEWAEIDSTGLDGQGRYTLAGLAPGDYRLEFTDYAGVLLDEYWDDATDIDAADDIRVASGTTQTGKNATLAVAPPLVNTARPAVSGSPVAGGTLTVDAGRWDTDLDVVWFEWLLDGTPIDGAYGPSYVPTVAQIGHQLTVRVTAWAPGRRIAEVLADPVVVTPTAPGSVQATRRAPTTLGLGWSASPGASGYRLTIRTDARTRTVLVGATTSSFLSGLDPARVHTITVEALGSRGVASPGTTMNVSTTPIPPASRLKATKRTKNSIKLSWAKPEGSSTFRVSYRTGSGRKKYVSSGRNSAVTVRKLTSKKAYSFTVEAISADGRARTVSRPVTIKTR